MSIKSIKIVRQLMPEDIQEMRRVLVGQTGNVDLLRMHPDVRIDLELRGLVDHEPDGAGGPTVPLVQGIRLETDQHLWNQRGQFVVQLQAADIIEVILVEKAYEPNPDDFILQVLRANAATGFLATQVIVHPAVVEYLEARGAPVGQRVRGLALFRNPSLTLGDGGYLVEVTNGCLSARFGFTFRRSFTARDGA
jgi:hypothetical protein